MLSFSPRCRFKLGDFGLSTVRVKGKSGGGQGVAANAEGYGIAGLGMEVVDAGDGLGEERTTGVGTASYAR